MMKKSLLTVSVLSAISAAICGTAFADETDAPDNSSTFCKPGFYAGVQGGASDTFYHKNDVFKPIAGGNTTQQQFDFPDALLPGSIAAPPPGPFGNYLILLNTINVHSTTATSLLAQQIDTKGLGGRIYGGYQFNPYFALETGYTQYSKTSFAASQTNTATQITSADYDRLGNNDTGVDTITQNFSSNTQYNGEITEHALDLVAKATVPLVAGFGAYLDAGMAYVSANRYINASTGNGTITQNELFTDSDGGSASTTLPTISTSSGGIDTVYDRTFQAFRPVAGAGLDYTFPASNIDLNVFYNRLFGNENNGLGIPDASLWGAGIGYKFA